MFRANPMHTGVSSSNLASRPSLLWLAEIGEIVASPVFSNDVLYIPSMLGMIFALNSKEKKVLWHLDIGSPLISSPSIHKDTLSGNI
jgi:outer membrane protein assembly factor BamB